MSGRGEARGGEGFRTTIRGALVVVAIAAVLGLFSTNSRLERPALSLLNMLGVVVMLVGLIVVLLARPIQAKLAPGKVNAAVFIKLSGLLVCGVGAMLVFL